MAAALRLTVTEAGRDALRNAAGNGTNAILIATAGITATPFTSGNPVPNELKRIATIAGGATAADTIHVTISDTSADVYSARGFGLYLADGVTLFASYGQADVIVEKSAQAAMLLAFDIQFADIDATQITFGDTNFSNPAATTERMGVVELTTDAEAIAGTDPARAVTAKALLAVLNARLGPGAPSDFVKTLLTKATVLAFVTALGIRSAAQYDTGAGNGLDADKLDGKEGAFYQAWANLTGVPTSFPPAAHEHSAADITSGKLLVARGGTGAGTFPVGSFLVGNGTAALGSLTPQDALQAIGAAAKQHSHQQGDIIGLVDALAAKADAADLTKKVNRSGDTMTGWLDVAPPEGTSATIRLNAAPSSNNALIYQKGGKNRWSFTGSVNEEIGANAGSDFVLQAFNDAGAYLRDCIAISRSTGTFYAYADVSVSRTLYSQGDALVLGTSGANPAGSLIYLRPGGTNSTSGQVVVRGSNGNVELSQGGTLGLTQQDNAAPSNAPIRVGLSGNNANGIGGSFANWNASRMPALQIDAGNDGSAYMIARVTHWGSKHLVGIDAYAAGGNAQLVFHCGTANTHTFDQAGNMTSSGRITAIGGFNVSDRREKTNIKRRAVSAGIASRVRKVYSSWNWKHDGQADTGVIAQLLLRFAPQHIREFSRPHKRLMGKQVTRLSVDKPGLALECALDADRRVDEVVKQNAALLRRIEKLERKRT